MIITVYVLTAILVTHAGFLKPMKVDIETEVFADEYRCLRNVQGNQADLEKKYDQVKMYCQPREIVPTKKVE